MKLRVVSLLFVLLLQAPIRAADTLPVKLTDEAFWGLIQDLSEPSAAFPGENYVSNEPKYVEPLTELLKSSKPGGVYIGVGPEQNFNFIAATRPKMAFILDIRRQNALELLMYRGLFEMSSDRATFLSKLFSRPRPANLSDTSSATALMDAYLKTVEVPSLFEENRNSLGKKLRDDHGFQLTDEDFAAITKIYKIFSQWGATTNYASDSAVGARIARGEINVFPTYAALMTMKDSAGTVMSFLATEESYRFVREMELNGLVVPITGDFAGPKAMRSIGQYLKDHGALVSTFYVSNVEAYLLRTVTAGPAAAINGGWKNYMSNVSTLPIDEHSAFLRWLATQNPGQIDLIQDTLRVHQEGRINAAADLTQNRK